MKIIADFYNNLKGVIDPLVGILLGSLLSYKIAFGQVRNSNKFIVLSEIKRELMLSIDTLHKNMNILIIKTNSFYKYAKSRDYSNVRNLLDELLFLQNELTQNKNTLISNFELLNSIFIDYNGKSKLGHTIQLSDNYLRYYSNDIYSKMINPEFYLDDFVADDKYIRLLEDFEIALHNKEFEEYSRNLGDCHVGEVVQYVNDRLAKLVK